MAAKPARLIFQGREFEVPKTNIVDLKLFADVVLSKPYTVTADVSMSAFETFVSALSKEDVDVTVHNYAELVILSEMFGFQDLDVKIGQAREEAQSGCNVGLRDRLRQIEKTLESIQGYNRCLPDLISRVTALETFRTSVITKDTSAIMDANAVMRDELNSLSEKFSSLAAQLSEEREARQVDTRALKARGVRPQTMWGIAPVADESPVISSPPCTGTADRTIRVRSTTQIEKMRPLFAPGTREFKLAHKNSFHGIIAHLATLQGRNAAKKSLLKKAIIDVSSSSVLNGNKAKNAVDLGDDKSFYQSNNEPRQWICMDFKNRKVNVTDYSLSSGYLKFWIIEGSLDGKVWNQLDQREGIDDTTNLSGASFTIADVSRDEYRYIKLVQTGKNHHGEDNLILFKIELFGMLIE